MKKVFSNSQTCHVWAQQSQSEGRSSNGNIFFHSNTIYSYGYHFPLASFIDDSTVLINSDSYSVSTSKHQSYVRNAINHKKRIYASTNVIKALIWDNSFNEQAQKESLRECKMEVEKNVQRAKAKKAAKYKANDINAARSAIESCKELFNTFGIAYPAQLIELENLVSTDDFNAIIQSDNDRQKKEAEEKEKRQKEIEAEVLADIRKNWINHKPMESVHSLYSCSKIFMRIDGNEIVTTRGARFPVEHAKKAFPIVRKAKENNATYIKKCAEGETPPSFRLGHFTIDEINEQGNVKAGCHFVEWDEIERIARILEIYP